MSRAGRGWRGLGLLAALAGAPPPGLCQDRTPPALYWEQPIATAAALRHAGIDVLRVPPAGVAEWRRAGFDATPLTPGERSARVALEPPGIVARADRASATRRPWIDANGWRYQRQPQARFIQTAPTGAAVLAAAEAFAHAADLVLTIDLGDLEPLGRALAFCRALPEAPLAGIADLGVVDDASPLTGELMNLLARRNLLFLPVTGPTPELPLTVELGSPAYPTSDAANPDALALRIRAELGDARRSLRLFGSEVVLARLTGDAEKRRLHLLNYGGRKIEGLRVRVRGLWSPGEARVLELGQLPVVAVLRQDGVTEFSLPGLGPYAVVDLVAAP